MPVDHKISFVHFDARDEPSVKVRKRPQSLGFLAEIFFPLQLALQHRQGQ
jgi:hypothetical protein